MDELRRSPRTPSFSEFNWKVISLALSGKSVDISKVIAMIDEMLTLLQAEHGEDNCDKAHCSKNFDQRGRDQGAGSSLIKDYQRYQPSCNDAHIDAVQKSSSELDSSVKKGTEIRQTACRIRRQQYRRDGFDQARCQQVERLHEAAPKAEFSSADRVYVYMEGGNNTAAQGALVQVKCERRDAELLRAEAKEVLASAGEVVDVKAAPAFDAENSHPAANIGALTMTALASTGKDGYLVRSMLLIPTNKADRQPIRDGWSGRNRGTCLVITY